MGVERVEQGACKALAAGILAHEHALELGVAVVLHEGRHAERPPVGAGHEDRDPRLLEGLERQDEVLLGRVQRLGELLARAQQLGDAGLSWGLDSDTHATIL